MDYVSLGGPTVAEPRPCHPRLYISAKHNAPTFNVSNKHPVAARNVIISCPDPLEKSSESFIPIRQAFDECNWATSGCLKFKRRLGGAEGDTTTALGEGAMAGRFILHGRPSAPDSQVTLWNWVSHVSPRVALFCFGKSVEWLLLSVMKNWMMLIVADSQPSGWVAWPISHQWRLLSNGLMIFRPSKTTIIIKRQPALTVA